MHMRGLAVAWIAMAVACGSPSSEPAPSAPSAPPPPEPAQTQSAPTAARAEPRCTFSGEWEPMAWSPVAAPPNAQVVDVASGGTPARFFRWAGGTMGELRWARWDGTRWIVSGSGARRWPRALEMTERHAVPVATDRFAIVTRTDGTAGAAYLAQVWLVGTEGALRAIPFEGTDALDDALVTDAGEVFLHFRRSPDQHRVIHLAVDGSIVARRDVELDGTVVGVAGDGARVGLVESTAEGARLHPIEGTTIPLPLGAIERDAHGRAAIATTTCTGAAAGLRFGTPVTWNVADLGVDEAHVTSELRGSSSCVRAVTAAFGAGGEPWPEESTYTLEARASADGALVGRVVHTDGRSRAVRCDPSGRDGGSAGGER